MRTGYRQPAVIRKDNGWEQKERKEYQVEQAGKNRACGFLPASVPVASDPQGQRRNREQDREAYKQRYKTPFLADAQQSQPCCQDLCRPEKQTVPSPQPSLRFSPAGPDSQSDLQNCKNEKHDTTHIKHRSFL